MRNHKNENELELLDAAVSGDDDAFGKLIAPYIPSLKRFVGRLVSSPEKQLLARLIKVEARLPPKLAETYRLRYFGELSYQGIAQQVGIQVGAVARESIARVGPWTSCRVEKGIRTLADSSQLVLLDQAGIPASPLNQNGSSSLSSPSESVASTSLSTGLTGSSSFLGG